MPDSQLTKRALSAAMKELMAEQPMEKIKIGDIVERCGMNRQSFYYHFKDKYDLVNWIYYTEFFADIRSSLEKPGWELLEKICDYFYRNRAFYGNALHVQGQNSFSEYFAEVLHPVIHSLIDDIFSDDMNHDFYVNFITDAIRVSITRWLLEGAKICPDEYVRLMRTATTGFAYQVIKEDRNQS
ncbi:MAG: TetR/AcrR family transcriptional regulator C-terminal domain-containing protein [Clostridiaceae bacterium]|nr:TetR/AcrR family transcriptional regulator C-terminal domain-containing protein [Clostridiaceae bacterium]